MSTTSPTAASSTDSRSATSHTQDGAGAAAATPSSRILKGKYEIQENVGESERCFLFRGKLLPEGDPIAVKILRDRYARDRDFVERYSGELRTTSNLPRHPAILRYHEIDTLSKRFCIISEFFEGDCLESVISEGTLPYPTLVSVLRQLNGLLEMGLQEGLMNRVIRLEDVLLEKQGRRIKLQRFSSPRRPSVPSSRPATSGKSNGPDILFLGVCLFRMLSAGEYPFQGRDDVAEIVVEKLKENAKIRYPELTGPEIDALGRLFVGATTRELGQRMEEFSDVVRALDELDRLNQTVQEELRIAEKARVIEEERTEHGSAFDTVALLQGRSRRREGPDGEAMRQLSRPLESEEGLFDPNEEPGGMFAVTNLAIGGCTVLLIALVYWLFQ